MADTFLEQAFMFLMLGMLFPLLLYPTIYPGTTCIKEGFRYPCQFNLKTYLIMIAIFVVSVIGFFITMRIDGI